VTAAWGSAITVVNERWWLNCKIDGSGVFLHDLQAASPFAENVADANPEIVKQLFAQGVADGGGEFPEFLLELAASQADAPGCSALAARA
jgi:hypothetical protein